MIVVDSDVLIEIYDRGSERGGYAAKALRDCGDAFCVTAVGLHEVLYGLAKYAKPSEYLESIPVLPYSKEDAMLSAKLELASERAGRRVPRLDSMTAAVAINAGAKLYTFDANFNELVGHGLKLFGQKP